MSALCKPLEINYRFPVFARDYPIRSQLRIIFELFREEGSLNVRTERFRCSFRVGIEVLLAMRFEQRPPSWPHCPSERLGEGV